MVFVLACAPRDFVAVNATEDTDILGTGGGTVENPFSTLRYTYTVSDGEATITACDTSVSGTLFIPSVLDGYPVTGIGSYAFANCSGLTYIMIPDSITTIGASAFSECSGLEEITLFGSVTVIENAAFDGCTGLTDVQYIGTEEEKAAIEIGFYNDPFVSADWHYIEPVAMHKQGDIQTYYSALEDILATATGGTITLLADVTTDDVSIHSGAVLDLNGHTLTANSIEGKVMDSADGQGFIRVDVQDAFLCSDDDQLILWDNTTDRSGYRVFSYTFINMGKDARGDDATESEITGTIVRSFWSDLVFTNPYAYTLVASEKSGLSVAFELSWTPDGGTKTSKIYQFGGAVLTSWALEEEKNFGDKNYCFYIRVTGFEGLKANGTVTVKPVLHTAFNSVEAEVTENRYQMG